ncbi:MAG: hypothetical protein ACI4N3_01250 [Alphaproteobacteria bacterium]
MENILSYLIIIFVTALFSIFYFAMLKLGMNKVLSKEDEKFGNMGYLYGSFLLRFLLAGIFFFLLLKYYRDLDELALVVLTFLVVRYLIVKREKAKIINKKGNKE